MIIDWILILKNLYEDPKAFGETGQTLVEYALILLLIAIVLIGIVTFLGGNLRNTFNLIQSSIPYP